jgi:hypothetical protein
LTLNAEIIIFKMFEIRNGFLSACLLNQTLSLQNERKWQFESVVTHSFKLPENAKQFSGVIIIIAD